MSRTPAGEPLRYLQTVVLNHDSDECLIWPYARLHPIDVPSSGYALLYRPGISRPVVASRYVCELVYGPPPTSKHEAAHSCGKGHLGCVNPRHLRWASQVENKSDELLHGTRNRGERSGASRLTEVQVREILTQRDTTPAKKLSSVYGVSPVHIRNIWRGKKWGYLTNTDPHTLGRVGSKGQHSLGKE